MDSKGPFIKGQLEYVGLTTIFLLNWLAFCDGCWIKVVKSCYEGSKRCLFQVARLAWEDDRSVRVRTVRVADLQLNASSHCEICMDLESQGV